MMKTRKTKDLQRVLRKKGFALDPTKNHHEYYCLLLDGKRTAVNTYFSHNGQEYGPSLMKLIKQQLRFVTTQQMEDFFDCPMSAVKYVEMLQSAGVAL